MERKNGMKQRLRQALILVAAVLLIMMLSSCGEAKYANSEYTGKWKGTTASMSGFDLDVSKVLGGDFIVELKEDGSAKATIGDDSSSGNWEETDDGFKLKDSSDELKFKKTAKGKAKVSYEGVDIVFEKQ